MTTLTPRVRARIEDALWLIETGCGWAEVVRRSDCTEAALERSLERDGHNEEIIRARARDQARGLRRPPTRGTP